VQEEALDEVSCLEGEELLCVAVPSIAIAKGYMAILERQQALVTDGDAVGVSAEVSQYLGGTSHGCFAVDDPVPCRRLFQQPKPE
jgi:hypothetical protein